MKCENDSGDENLSPKLNGFNNTLCNRNQFWVCMMDADFGGRFNASIGVCNQTVNQCYFQSGTTNTPCFLADDNLSIQLPGGSPRPLYK